MGAPMAASSSGTTQLERQLEQVGYDRLVSMLAAGAAPQAPPATLAESIHLCIRALAAGGTEDVQTAAAALALVLSEIDDDKDLAVIGQVLRGDGCIEILCALLEHENAQTNTDALLVLGNLVIDSVDPVGAGETKQRIHDAGGFPKLLSHLYSTDGSTLLYATGAVMNALFNIEQVQLMQSLGVMPRLQELAGLGLAAETNLAGFAQGCLHNMRAISMRGGAPPQSAPTAEQPEAVAAAAAAAAPMPLALPPPPQAEVSFVPHSMRLCLETLRSSDDEEEVASALAMLAQLQSLSPDPRELSELGQLLRSLGCVERLCELLSHADPGIHAHTLLVLGNLAADSIDPDGAAATKQLIAKAGGVARLIVHLDSEEPETLVYAAGAVMNLSSDAELCALLVAEGIVPRLQELSGSAEPQLAEFAGYALVNMREAIMHQSATELYQKRLKKLAAIELQSATRRWIAVKRVMAIRLHRRNMRQRWRKAVLRAAGVARFTAWSWRRNDAASTIQLYGRRRLGRRHVKQMAFEQRHAASTIQRCLREYWGAIQAAATIAAVHKKLRKLRELEVMHQASSVIGRRYRTHLGYRLRLEAIDAAIRIQCSVRGLQRRRGWSARMIQRAYLLHAARRRGDAASAAAQLMLSRPQVPKLPTGTAVALSLDRKKKPRKTGGVVIVSPRSDGSMIKLKGNLAMMSPRFADYGPWFATTLENTSEYTLETERVQSTRNPNVADSIRDSTRDSIDLMVRAGDATKARVLSRRDSELARSGREPTRRSSEDSGSDEEASPAPFRGVRVQSPPRRGGCWPWGRSKRAARAYTPGWGSRRPPPPPKTPPVARVRRYPFSSRDGTMTRHNSSSRILIPMDAPRR